MHGKSSAPATAVQSASAQQEYIAQRHLAAIVDASGDAIISLTTDGVIETWNRSAELLYGYSAKEAVGQNAQALLARDPDERLELLASALAGTAPAQAESQDVRKDGTLLDVSVTDSPISDSRGRVIGIARIARDVTERTRADAASARLVAIVESSGDAIASLTPDCVIETWNKSAELLYGYPAAEAVGENALTLLARDPIEREELMAIATSGAGVAHVARQDVRKDGSLIDVSITASPISNPQGRVIGIARIARDVTERTSAAAARARLAAIVDASGDAIISLTTGGVIETWNRSAEQLYGYSAKEAVGQNAQALLARDPDERLELLASALAGTAPAQAESQDVRKDGSLLDVSVTDAPISDSQGEVIGIARIARDVTSRVEADMVRRGAVVEVAAARDEALEASRLKSAFLANMSHEIRTPLNGVIGMADLLLDSQLDEEQHENARLLRGAGETLVAVVNDILDFSKIEAGALRLEQVDFDPIETVENAADLIAELAREKGVELTMNLASALPEMVRGDAVRVTQVITNLLSNAVKFTSVGEISVAVTAERSGHDRTLMHFKVEDTGVGIDEQRLAQMFMPFIQADDSTTRRFGGSGLGLAIVKQLVEMMGGDVGAESVLGEGSCFWFTVPFELAANPRASDGKQAVLAGTKLLVVDDNATNRRLIAQLGARWDMEVTTASGAAEALVHLREAAAHHQPFDCAALDLHMPDTNGIELARAMRADATFPTPALIMLTSTADDRREARDAGVDVYMTKPVRRTRLFNALAEAKGIRTRREEAPTARRGETRSAPMILVADDNDVNQILAIRMLERRGYRVEAVADGRQALEALERPRYAAVLMDCQMPEQSGYDATSELRLREHGSSHIPVIAMTAHALDGDREKCLDSGMDDYLAKPLRPEELDRVLRMWAPMSREPDAAMPPPAVTGNDVPEIDGALSRSGIMQLVAELGSTDALRRPVELFDAQTPEILEAMRSAITAEDARLLKGSAHKLKGGSTALAATQMTELCNDLEIQAGTGSLDGASTLVDEIERAFGRTRAALLAEVGDVRP
jgi:PAS domain S-box-containing protein